ncbi:MAG TPA: response regulator transcription factor [Dongiaceae bacterium]|nr:response regulator transcription factor [Dongiaceae bacterium]
MPKPRILLADDHTLIVEAFTKLLEPQFQVVGSAADGRALLQKASDLRPDVILLDLSMPVLNGFEAGERLKKLLPNTKLVVLTMTEDVDVAAELLDTWASAFLLKKSASEELVRAIQQVLKGKVFLTSHMARAMEDKFAQGPRISRERALTSRQREVLQLLAEGRTMKEAAHVLNVTPRTVAFHKYKIMEEFELKTNSDLLRFAMKQRLIP